MAKPASPGKHGDGREIGDIRLQAQHYSTRCLEMLGNVIEDTKVDLKTRFIIAKFLIELGWGKPRQMAAPVEQSLETLNLTTVMAQQFNIFMEQLTDDRQDNGGCDDQPQGDREPGKNGMAPDSTQQPEDAAW